jgi:hypothetical protein
MARRSARDLAREPRFVIAETDADGNPTAVYARTYEAISRIDVARRRPHRRRTAWRVLAVMLVAVAAVVLVLRPDVHRWHVLRPHRATAPAVRHAAVPAPTPATAVASAATPAPPEPPPAVPRPALLGVAPATPKANLRAGDTQDFALLARGLRLRYAWLLDGRPAGTEPRWTYSPSLADVGTHRIMATAEGPGGAVHQVWAVRVRPARAPRVRAASPGADSIAATAGTPVRLHVEAEAARAGEALRVTWDIDGKPAGDGPTLTLRPDAGTTTVRVAVAGALGGVATRTWRIDAAEPVETARVETPAPAGDEPPPRPRIVATPEPEPASPRRAVSGVSRPAMRVAVRPVPRATAPPAEPRQDEVLRWLDRYAAAWRARDVDTLRRLGQITTDRDAAALRGYFASVRDLDVQLDLLDIHTRGDTAVVRFTRRDRFRDPAGRLVLKESPPIEKTLQRTPDGLRLIHPRG